MLPWPLVESPPGRAPACPRPGRRRRRLGRRTSAAPAPGDESPPYLLVVESDPELQQRIGETLREARYELATEAEGVWAKRSMLIRPPDAIILDTHLSDGSGFQVAEAIRRDPETEKIPIFFIASRFRGAKHRTEARRRFAPAEYLPTPLDFDSLLARLLETVPPRDQRGAGHAPTTRRASPADPAQRRERREVEQEARELTGRTAGMRGSLAREPFARILQRIYSNGSTGALLLARDQAKKIVYFQNGYPVSVRSNLLGECLGQILVARRLINSAGAGGVAAPHAPGEAPPGRDPRRDGGAVPAQPRAGPAGPDGGQAVRDLRLARGQLPLQRGARRRPTSRSPSTRARRRMILEGIRRHYDLDRQNAVLGRFDGQYVAPNEDPRQRLQSITRDPGERELHREPRRHPPAGAGAGRGAHLRPARPACCWWRWPRRG